MFMARLYPLDSRRFNFASPSTHRIASVEGDEDGKKADLVEGRNNMLRRKTHESCIKTKMGLKWN
jgi:hypothetical protein